jgi:hypothetical protein
MTLFAIGAAQHQDRQDAPAAMSNNFLGSAGNYSFVKKIAILKSGVRNMRAGWF